MGKIGADRDYEQCFDSVHHITEPELEHVVSSESISLHNKTAHDFKIGRNEAYTQSTKAPIVVSIFCWTKFSLTILSNSVVFSTCVVRIMNLELKNSANFLSKYQA